jgi:hypothetical protein
MSGYEFKSRNSSLKGMTHRLTWSEAEFHESEEGDNIAEYAALKGLGQQHRLLITGGGYPQQDRMILDKKRSLDRALKYSYQGAFIKKVDDSAVPWSLDRGDANNKPRIRALINPNKLKMDYDDKIISVPKEHGFKAGDVFEWENTGTHWLITLQDKTELAYFRGDIRRCGYKIRWNGPDGIHECFAATRGPVETKINFIQKTGVSLDTPNHSLNILMPKRKDVLEYFKRYSKFYLSSSLFEEDPDNQYEDYQICFRVEATDWVSTPGVFEMTAVEYYANKDEDDIEAGIVGIKVLNEEEENPNDDLVESRITGETFIKPLIEYKYIYHGLSGNRWQIDTKKYPVQFSVNPEDGREIILKWTQSFSGQFEISCAGVTKTIVVESLF